MVCGWACSRITNCSFGTTVDGWNQSARVGREYSWAAAHKDSMDIMCRSILKVSQVSSCRGFQSTPSFCAHVLYSSTPYCGKSTELACLLPFLWLCGCESKPTAHYCLWCAHSTCVFFNFFFYYCHRYQYNTIRKIPCLCITREHHCSQGVCIILQRICLFFLSTDILISSITSLI